MRTSTRIVAIVLALAFLPPTAEATTRAPFQYAVVLSAETARDPRWAEVAGALASKYPGARTFTFERLEDLIAPLRTFSPDYIAFVARPWEATPDFVRRASRLNRKLGNEPYGLAVWGVVTGHGPEDALRIARNGKPPVIRFGLGGTRGFLDALPEGVAYSEFIDSRREWQERKPGQRVKDRRDGPVEHLLPMVELLNGNGVDVVWTSGHAGKDIWTVYYPEGPSDVVAADGLLTAMVDGEPRGEIRTSNPKVYLAVGNCLTARIEDPDASYALAWIHSGGVNQYFGFIEETSHGLVGWGTADNFFFRGGRFNAAESAFVANQSLLLAIHGRLAPDEMEELEHDRDATVVYGDPAWMATVPESTAREAEHWSTRLERVQAGKKVRWELTVTFRKAMDLSPAEGKDLRPVFAFLPERVKNPKLAGRTEGVQAAHVAANFVVVQFRGKVAAGETRKLLFESE